MAEAKGMKTNQVAGTPLGGGRGCGVRPKHDGGSERGKEGMMGVGHTKRCKDEPYDLER